MAQNGNGRSPGEHMNGTRQNGKKPEDKQHLVDGTDTKPKYNGATPSEDGQDKTKEKQPVVPLFQLFRFADKWDTMLVIIGFICAILNGAYFPLTLVLFANTIDKFVKFENYLVLLGKIPEFLQHINMTKYEARKETDRFIENCDDLWDFYNHTEDKECTSSRHYDVYSEMETNALYFLILGGIAGIGGCGQVYCFIVAADRQITRMRLAFYKNIIRQEMGWFDATGVGELTVKFTEDIGKIHDAIGDKLAGSFQNISSSFTSIGLSFYYGWKFTLVMQCCSPLMFLAYSFMGASVNAFSSSERQAYAEAGNVAEEVFSSIRTVQAFGGQKKEASRYGGKLQAAHNFGVKKSLALGVGQGVAYSVMYMSWALGYWYGGKLVRDGDYNITEMLAVFLSAMMFIQCLGMATPGLVNLSLGRAAAYSVYKFIDKPTEIDSLSESGLQPTTLTGNIRLQGVHFTYPTRPEAKILRGLDLTVSAGQTVALVGPSGCGKSTVMQLLLRFYDPNAGQLSLDGVDIRDINIGWLRRSIGLVSQEPILFATSIAENIRYGRDGVTMAEIVQASKEANCYDFISKLPDGFETHVGERGAALSGGQKQRIAIARALVKKPKILLLDEATSALDTESEAVVQDALDKARKGRTTLIIAHRLTTIRDADVIVVINQGKVAELGSHDQLMALGGIYSGLVSSQLTEGSDVQLTDTTDKSGRRGSHPGKNAERRGSNQSRTRTRTESSDHEDMVPENITMGQSLKRIMRLNKPEALYIVLGCLGALFNGAQQTASVMIIAQSVEAFAKEDPSQEKHEMDRLSLICLGSSFVVAVAYILQEYMFGLSGEALTKKVRDILFRAMVRQDIGWFDDQENDTGKLTARLSLEASAVQGSLKTSLGYTTLAFGNVVTGFLCAFIFGWRLALVLFALVPIQILSGLTSMKVYGGAANKEKAVMEDVSREAMESVDNIRTVASLTKEMTIYRQVEDKLWTPVKNSVVKSLVSCVLYGVSQAVHFMSFGLAFWYAARLLRDDKIGTIDVFRVLGPMIMGTQQLGRFVAFAPDVGKSLKAAARIFDLQDRQPPIDATSSKGDKPAQDSFSARVKFSNLHFRYPTRPDVKILNGLDLSVEPGQTLALVGESGCGKSTTVQLVERFYDPEGGRVTLDTYNMKDLNIQWLRAQIGLVSQEPTLFDQSIAENIAYGDNSRTVSMDEIITAAKSANIHNFIQSLPMGYDTNVGSKGTQLSGGQKQRVAIARALVRKPKILLLDEATSALDAESEKIVQEALDKARAGRTCITIAHRLTTIKDADKIAVFKNGVVHEIGTHDTLMAKRGLYYKLQQAQNK